MPSSPPSVMNTALDAIGNTPLIRLNRIARHANLKCNLLAKVEFCSIGGSMKDRVAKRMIEKAEEQGILVPGKSVIIEATSGNTGIGLALVGALKGYPVIITLPSRMSLEKEYTLRALGATIIRTPCVPTSSPESNHSIAKRLEKLIPGGVILGQFDNDENAKAHELGTAVEIIEAVEGMQDGGKKVDAFFAGAGTGGTLTGMARSLKQHNSSVAIVGVDPRGSSMARPVALNQLGEGQSGAFKIEGIGGDFIPSLLDLNLVSSWVKVNDSAAFSHARLAMQQEGLLVGGSSGATLAGALEWLTSKEGYELVGGVKGSNAVVMFADGIRNYMSQAWFGEELMHMEPGPMDALVQEALKSPVVEMITAPMSRISLVAEKCWVNSTDAEGVVTKDEVEVQVTPSFL